ncbi:MAG: DUF4920 domain-containing protein [Bacteroidota bacterium]
MKFHFKIIAVSLFIFSIVSSCQFQKNNQYGVLVDSTQAITTAQLIMQEPSKDVTVKGTITAVCQGEGCWLKLDAGNGIQVFVDWDKKFSVPRGIEGKKVFMHGYSYLDTVTVAELKQMERDKGTANEEIMKIDSPLISMAFRADGLEIK